MVGCGMHALALHMHRLRCMRRKGLLFCCPFDCYCAIFRHAIFGKVIQSAGVRFLIDLEVRSRVVLAIKVLELG